MPLTRQTAQAAVAKAQDTLRAARKSLATRVVNLERINANRSKTTGAAAMPVVPLDRALTSTVKDLTSESELAVAASTPHTDEETAKALKFLRDNNADVVLKADAIRSGLPADVAAVIPADGILELLHLNKLNIPASANLMANLGYAGGRLNWVSAPATGVMTGENFKRNFYQQLLLAKYDDKSLASDKEVYRATGLDIADRDNPTELDLYFLAKFEQFKERLKEEIEDGPTKAARLAAIDALTYEEFVIINRNAAEVVAQQDSGSPLTARELEVTSLIGSKNSNRTKGSGEALALVSEIIKNYYNPLVAENPNAAVDPVTNPALNAAYFTQDKIRNHRKPVREESAIAIQRVFRGYKVRKNLRSTIEAENADRERRRAAGETGPGVRPVEFFGRAKEEEEAKDGYAATERSDVASDDGRGSTRSGPGRVDLGGTGRRRRGGGAALSVVSSDDGTVDSDLFRGRRGRRRSDASDAGLRHFSSRFSVASGDTDVSDAASTGSHDTDDSDDTASVNSLGRLSTGSGGHGRGGAVDDGSSFASADDDDSSVASVEDAAAKAGLAKAGATDIDPEWTQVERKDLVDRGYYDNPNNGLIPQIIGQSFGVKPKADYSSGIALNRSGWPIFIYGDGTAQASRAGLHEFTRQCHSANHSRTLTGETRLASIAQILNLDGNGDLFCVATLSSRGLTQNWIPEKEFDRVVRPVCDRLYENCLHHEDRLRDIEEIAGIVEEIAAGKDLTSPASIPLFKMAEDLQKYIEAQRAALEAPATTDRDKAGIYRDITETHQRLKKEIQSNPDLSAEEKKEMTEILEATEKTPRNPPKIERDQARQFASSQFSNFLAEEVERSIVDNQLRIDLDDREVKSLSLKLASAGAVEATGKTELQIRSLLQTAMPHSPFPGAISMLSPPHSNITAITFNERTDKHAWVYIPGTPECYVKVRVCNYDGEFIPTYRNGQLVKDAPPHKKGDIIMDEGTIYHFNKRTGDYGNPIDASEQTSLGDTFITSALTKEFGSSAQARTVREGLKKLDIKAMSTIDGERHVAIMTGGKKFSESLGVKAATHAVVADAAGKMSAIDPKPLTFELDTSGALKKGLGESYFVKVMDVSRGTAAAGLEILAKVTVDAATGEIKVDKGQYFREIDPATGNMGAVQSTPLDRKLEDRGFTTEERSQFKKKFAEAEVVVTFKQDTSTTTPPDVSYRRMQPGATHLPGNPSKNPKPLGAKALARTPETVQVR